jgi:uncharacterized protein (DUF1778 family)
MSVVKSINEQSRINFRLASEIKERVARAATIIGQDLTEFAIATLNQRAVEIIEKHDSMILESDDYRIFLNSLEGSEMPEPSIKSQEIAEKYRRGMRKGVRYHLAD